MALGIGELSPAQDTSASGAVEPGTGANFVPNFPRPFDEFRAALPAVGLFAKFLRWFHACPIWLSRSRAAVIKKPQPFGL